MKKHIVFIIGIMISASLCGMAKYKRPTGGVDEYEEALLKVKDLADKKETLEDEIEEMSELLKKGIEFSKTYPIPLTPEMIKYQNLGIKSKSNALRKITQQWQEAKVKLDNIIQERYRE